MLAEQTTMNVEEFQQHHTRTWEYVARVGKIWEAIAEEQQAIVDGKGYRHGGYSSYAEYWNLEFAIKTGWTDKTIQNWMDARRVKINTPNTAGRNIELGIEQWKALGRLEAPDQRAEFLEQYEDEIKPRLKAEGVTSQIFREGVKEFKGERNPTVRESVPPEAMEDLPNPGLTREENWVFESQTIASAIKRFSPGIVAAHAQHIATEEELIGYARSAEQVAEWFDRYAKELRARAEKRPLRAVN